MNVSPAVNTKPFVWTLKDPSWQIFSFLTFLSRSLQKKSAALGIRSKVWIEQVKTAVELKAVGLLDPLGSRGPTGWGSALPDYKAHRSSFATSLQRNLTAVLYFHLPNELDKMAGGVGRLTNPGDC